MWLVKKSRWKIGVFNVKSNVNVNAWTCELILVLDCSFSQIGFVFENHKWHVLTSILYPLDFGFKL